MKRSTNRSLGLCAQSPKKGSVSKVEMAMFTLPVQRHSGAQTSP
jgi:hypothetical protein